MTIFQRPNWRLPTGVSRGLWEYVASDHIAEDYDDYFALNSLFEFDEAVIAKHLPQPGLVADLGCGTGRALMPLLERGFRGLAIDLSPAMLKIVREKAEQQGLAVDVLQANLVELEGVADSVIDYGICMFSTLGMIEGREARARALAHMTRILKPGGVLIFHLHNVWNNLLEPLWRRWLVRHLPQVLLRRDVDLGDKVFPYRGIPNMYVHAFSHRQIRHAMSEAGLNILEMIPLSTTRRHRLRCGWWLPRLRANGWIIACQKPLP